MPADEPLDVALVERARDAIRKHSLSQCEFELCDDMAGCICFDQARAALLATGIPAEALNALARGEAVVVPKEPTRMQWIAGRRLCKDAFEADTAAESAQVYRTMLATSPYAPPTDAPKG